MLNKCVFIGRLVRDPELRYTNNEGVAVANFTIAVDRGFTNQAGEKETDFIRITAWKKLGENVTSYKKKGDLVAVEGRLQLRNYEDREGVKRIAAEIVARNVVFLPDGRNKDNNAENAPVDDGDYYAGDSNGVGDEDVPF